MTENERPWTPEEAAAWFSVSEVTIRRWVREGRLARIPTGGALRITAASVSRLTRGEYQEHNRRDVRDTAAADTIGEALG